MVTFPKRVCNICSEEFELRPGKPGYANRCPACSDENDIAEKRLEKSEPRPDGALTDARRKAMRDLLYRKDS